MLLSKLGHCATTPFILVGTKADTRGQAESSVSKEEALKLCEELKGYKYLECSAMTQDGLKQVFDESIRCVIQSQKKPSSGGGKFCVIL